MSCRESAAGRALTRTAREVSGLSDVQVLSLVHSMRREYTQQHGRSTRATRLQREQLIDYLRQQRWIVNTGGAYSEADRVRIVGNLDDAIDAAENDPLTAADVHVWMNLERNAVDMTSARDTFLQSEAMRRGIPAEDMQTAYNTVLAHVGALRSRGADTTPIALSEFGTASSMVARAPGDWRTRLVLHRIQSYGSERCGDCGQYMAQTGHHDCPNYATASARAAAFTPPTPQTSEAPTTGRINTRIYRDPNGAITLHMPSAGGLRLAVTPETDARTIELNATSNDQETVSGTVEIAAVWRPVTRGGVERDGEAGRWRSQIVEIRAERRLRCTCADYRARYDCEHVRHTISTMNAVLNNERIPPATPPAAALATARAALEEEYEASQAALHGASPDVAPADMPGRVTARGFLEDPAPFYAAVQEAAARTREGNYALPFRMESGVLGESSAPGGPRTFGLELEVDFPDEDETHIGESKAQLALAAYEAGLSRHSSPLPWHYMGREQDGQGRSMGGDYSTDLDTWTVEWDRSVDPYEGRRGCEIKSPILSDTEEAWRGVYTMCNLIEAAGGRVTVKTGLHVNIGASDFDHTVGHHNRLLALGATYEDVLVRMSTSPEKGVAAHRGREYCQPVITAAEGFVSIRTLKRQQGSTTDERHRRFINLAHVPSEGENIRPSTRLEMRLFDGTTDPGRIQGAVILSASLAQAAADGRSPGMNPEPGGSHYARQRAATPTPDEDSESARRLIDLLPLSDEGRLTLAQMWGQNTWSRR